MNFYKTVTIRGNPIAKKRPRFVRRGKFVGTYNCQETEEGKFKWELLSQIGEMKPLEVPIRLTCRFFMPIPASISNKKRALYEGCAVAHTKKPDLDNLIKFVKDCGNGVLWKDDSQIISITASKAYHPSPATEIRIDW
jgi:Holliday junction resolvase RusA-like endonuclease